MRTMPRLSVLAVVLVSTPLAAQRVSEQRIGLTAPVAAVPARDAVDAALRPVHMSYWREGGVVTAVAAVLGFTLYAGSMDENGSDEPLGEQVLISALIAAVFFVPGALIGGLIPKK
jgi:hypothetical protein